MFNLDFDLNEFYNYMKDQFFPVNVKYSANLMYLYG